jgi:apolipoprotein N-acyltransferase
VTPANDYAGPGPTLRRHALAALSGVLLALSFPKFGNGVVAFFALTPLLVAVHGARPGQALGLGGLSGAFGALGTLYWTALVLVRYGGLGWPAALAALLLLSLAVALFPAVFAWMVARWVASSGAPALLAAPIAWVATEVLRAHTLLRFPWLLLGYSQHANLPVLQLAAYAAVYGVSFAVAGVSALLAYEVLEARRVHRRCAAVVAVSLLLAIWVHGHWMLSRPLREERRLRVGLVQASISQDDKWDPAQALAHVNRQIELSRDAATRGARLVVWPESAVPSHFDLSPALAAELRDLTRSLGIYLLFRNDDVESAGRSRLFYVGAKMLTPEGNVGLRYHKMQLVPFGEYVPLRPLLSLGGRLPAKLVQQVADFTPGDRAMVAPAGDARLGATICYEAIFPELVRRFTEAGAELLINITNDAWYGRSSAPQQHFVMAKFRAVENGIPHPGRQHRHQRGDRPARTGRGADRAVRTNRTRRGRVAPERRHVLCPPRRRVRLGLLRRCRHRDGCDVPATGSGAASPQTRKELPAYCTGKERLEPARSLRDRVDVLEGPAFHTPEGGRE